jgi:uncharacterized membrane protein
MTRFAAPRSTPPRRRARVWLVAAALAISAVALAAPASGVTPSAARAQQTTADEVNSWSLSPSGADPGQPGARPNLSYSLAPGATVEDSVVLRNYSNVQLTFRVYATDAFNNETGDFSLLDGNTAPKDVGSWVKVSQESITLAPDTGIDIPITIQVPADAQPGDHSGAILASSRTAAADGSRQVLLDRRVGSRLYLRVDGKVNPGLVVEDLKTSYDANVNPLGGDLDVSYTVRNAGNIRLGARQEVEINDLLGTVETRKGKDISQLLPGNSLTFHQHFSGIAATIRVSADVKITPVAIAGADVAPQPSTTRTAHTWAIPWSLLLLLAVLAAVVWVLRRQRRRAGRSGGASSPRSGPGGGQGGPNGTQVVNRNGSARTPVSLRGSRLGGRRISPP